MAKLSGLLQTTDPELGALAAASRDLRATAVPALAVEGPSALRPFLAAALAGGRDRRRRTVLAVTATDREAEDLGAAAADLLGSRRRRRAARAGRRCRTSGCRRARTPSAAGWRMLRRLADPAHRAAAWSSPPREPDPADRARPGRAGPGRRCGSATTHDFDGAAGPARRAGLHAGRDGREARRVRRPRRHRRRLPAHRRAPGAGRVLGRRGHRPAHASPSPTSARVAPVDELHRARLPGDAAHRRGPRAGPRRSPATAREQPAAGEMLEQPRRRHPGRGHGVADPGAGRRRAGAAHRPAAGRRATCCSPTPSGSAPAPRTWSAPGRSSWRRRWLAAGDRRRRADRPRRQSAYRGLDEVLEHASGDRALPIVHAEPAGLAARTTTLAPAVHEVESYRGDTDRALTDLRAPRRGRRHRRARRRRPRHRAARGRAAARGRRAARARRSGCRRAPSPAWSPSPAAASTDGFVPTDAAASCSSPRPT